MVEGDATIGAWNVVITDDPYAVPIVKNLSYDDETGSCSYHQRYYYPSLARRKCGRDAAAVADSESGSCVAAAAADTHDGTVEQSYENRSGTSNHVPTTRSARCQLHTTRSREWEHNHGRATSQTSLVGSPNSHLPGGLTGSDPRLSALPDISQQRSRTTTMEEEDNKVDSLCVPTAANDSGFLSPSSRKSSESVTSEDSVFSEDYTVMVDGLELPDQWREGGDWGGEDADSSFSSARSSTSTIAAADNGSPTTSGRQHGGGGDAVKDAGVKVTPDSSVSMSGPAPATTPVGAATADPDTSSFYEDREFDFLKAEPVRRSTSLKTYKTPPGTPSRKKGVRFADALGLDLESVRHILNLEDPPEVPKSAMNDLKVGLETEHRASGVKYLSALFSQPGVDPSFIARVLDGKVALENCVVNDKDMTLSGTVRVANVAFHKQVLVRYTTNDWVTSDDVTASYVQNSNDGTTDRFAFSLTLPMYFAVGQRLEFALLYSVGGATFWDNNFGKNYAVECYAKSLPASGNDNTWMHFL